MNTEATDRAAVNVARDIRRRVRERIELDTIVPHDSAEMFLVGGHLDFDEMLVLVSKRMTYDVGEQFIKSDGNGPTNVWWEGETGTELVQRAQAPIDLAEVVFEP